MLQFKIKEILMASGKQYPAVWLEKHCGFSKAKAYKFINDKQKSISLTDISKLCENLNCTPNDLMYWHETNHTKIPATHPCMTQLTLPDKNSDWDTIFKQLTPDKILELHTLAIEKINEKKG